MHNAFQESVIVCMQFGIDISNQSYPNAPATAVSRRTPLLWTEMMYCIRADMNIKYVDHCLSSAIAEQKHFFLHSGKISVFRKWVES